MATTIYLGSFSKRKNSTARPSIDNMTAFNVVLKNGCSETSPVFFLSLEGFITYNYCVWEGKYYWITDINYTLNNRIIISCKMDVLATLKPYIQETSAFVAYDTSGNSEIVDNRLSVKTTKTRQSGGVSRFSILGSGACAVVTIVGKYSTAAYAMDVGTATSLLNNITNWLDQANVLPIPPVQTFPDVMSALQVLCENLVRVGRQLIATGRAPQSIQSAVVVPMSVSNMLGVNANIYLGDYNTGVSALRIPLGAARVDEISCSIPWQAADWRRNSPYHELYLAMPYVGVVQLSPSDLIDDTSISILACIHCISGDTVFIIMAGQRTIMQFSTKMATPFAIGCANVTPMQGAMTVLSAIGSAAAIASTGGAAAIAAGSGAIAGVMNNLQPTLSSVGGAIGGAAVISQLNLAEVISIYHDTNVDPSSVSGVIGTPTMASKSLGSVSGYCECRCASVSAPYEQPILDECNSLLNTGFFME